MEGWRESLLGAKTEKKPKVVVVMGPTGSGKSRLAIDLALSHFPIEIINADSMQVYQDLDVLTNKVPLLEQKGVPHHLLGTISPSIEFTAKSFRDSAIPIIDGILSRNHLPVIVGGTNYYIQALVSPLLLDESVEDMDEKCIRGLVNKQPDCDFEPTTEINSYDILKNLDQVAANRIHPNDHRKIGQYLNLYTRFGVLPSELLQRKSMENWGHASNFRYNCCFICVDASLPVLDKHVEQRVDHMVDAGLLNEVYDIHNFNADYTRGLRQAIGVREFEDFLNAYICEGQCSNEYNLSDGSHHQISTDNGGHMLDENMKALMDSTNKDQLKVLLEDAIDQMKANTRRLVRRQKRRLIRLQSLFGWNIHFVDATNSILSASSNVWAAEVVKPSSRIIGSFLSQDESILPDSEACIGVQGSNLIQRDLWTRHVCQACGNRVLRGAHEWEQHIQGRSHRKRISRLKKSGHFEVTE